MLMKKLFLDFLEQRFVLLSDAKVVRFLSPTKKNPHLFHHLCGQTGI